MTPAPQNPDGVAAEEWAAADMVDCSSELDHRIRQIAGAYHDHYDVSFTEAAFRAAEEWVAWWRSENWDARGLGSLSLAHAVPSNMLPEVGSGYYLAAVDRVRDEYDRCGDWRDAAALTTAAVLGAAADRRGPSESPEFEETALETSPPPSGPDGDRWRAVLGADPGATAERLSTLEAIARDRAERTDESLSAARDAVFGSYGARQSTVVAVADTYAVRLRRRGDETFRATRLENAYAEAVDGDDGGGADAWLGAYCAVVCHAALRSNPDDVLYFGRLE